MKTTFKTTAKDTVATAAVLLAIFAGSITAVANSTAFNHDAMAVTETMEAIVITAQRMPVEKMGAIVVTASRHADVLVAAK